MGRFAAILLLAFASQTPAQDVALQIKGDVEIVKVTRLVPLVEDREIIKKLPRPRPAAESKPLRISSRSRSKRPIWL
jgi:hypothetical protein